MNKFSYVWSFDNSGLKVIKLLNSYKKQKISINTLLNIVAVKVYPKKKKVVKKKDKYYARVVSLKKIIQRYDGTKICISNNKCIVFEKKRLKFIGSKIYGCVQKELLKNSQKIQKIVKYSRLII